MVDPPAFEGVSRQAAVAGLLRSLSQLGAGHLLQAYARSPEAADSAQAAALSLGQWGGLGGGGGGLGGDSDGAQAALSSAVAGLQAGSIERCKGAVSGARRSLVAHLVTASLEGAANVNPALVQLQQLQAVSEAWELLWPALPDLGSVGSPRKRRKQQHAGSEGPAVAAAAAAAAATRALQEGVLQLWRGREASAGAGGRYNLQAPLQGRTLGMPGAARTWMPFGCPLPPPNTIALSCHLVVSGAAGRPQWLLCTDACLPVSNPPSPPPCRACTSSCCAAWVRPTSRRIRWCRVLWRRASLVGVVGRAALGSCLLLPPAILRLAAVLHRMYTAPPLKLLPPSADHFAQATTSLYQLRALLQAQAAAGDGGLPDWAAAMSAPDAKLAGGGGQAAVGAGAARHGGAASTQPARCQVSVGRKWVGGGRACGGG